MSCWYCRWGWPKPVADIYLRAEKDIDAILPVAGPDNDWTDWDGEPTSGESALRWGPAHCEWEDENFGGDHTGVIERCAEEVYADWHPGAMAIVKRSLQELSALPEDVRMPRPDYYERDGGDVDDYPPPPGVEMVRI